WRSLIVDENDAALITDGNNCIVCPSRNGTHSDTKHGARNCARHHVLRSGLIRIMPARCHVPGNRFPPQKGGTKLIQSTAIICREFPASNEGNYAGISGMNRLSYPFCREKQAMSHLPGNWQSQI